MGRPLLYATVLLALVGAGATTWWVFLRPSADQPMDLDEAMAEQTDESEGTTEPPDVPEADPDYFSIPKVDVHVHVPGAMTEAAVRLYARHDVVLSLNASGARALAAGYTHPAMPSYCRLDFRRAGDPEWDPCGSLAACKEAGGIGIKISKGLGLGYLYQDDLLAVDDPVLDAAFECAGELSLPILIHTGDPRAFFEAPTEDNERFEELSAHPSWSFYGPRPDGGAWPSWRELLRQFEARVARHPNTTFVGAHFGNAPEDPDFVAGMLARYPNYYIETGARIPEVGRHDAARMHDFFVRFQDRILFGTDFQVVPGGLILGSVGRTLDPLSRVPEFYDAHWRYFETREEDFDHPSPIQGNWTIDGIGLPREVLEKVYQRNALRVFGLSLPGENEPTGASPAESGPREPEGGESRGSSAME